jgi:colicin import membrane protein
MTETDLKYFLYSVAFHLTLVLVLTVKILAFPSVRPEMIRSVRVDFVAMPDKDPVEAPKGIEKEVEKAEPEPEKPVLAEKPPEKKEPAKKETPKETVKKEKPVRDEIVEKKKPEEASPKDRQSSALKRLQALAKIKKLKSAKETGPAGAVYKGNELSEGASLKGVEKLQRDQYLENLDVLIKRNWHLPEWLSTKGFTAAILLRFDETGKILERRFIRSSGNETFDREVTDAIEASAPLPPPPEGLISYFKVHGIELRFPE